jgi:hypothetical protein
LSIHYAFSLHSNSVTAEAIWLIDWSISLLAFWIHTLIVTCILTCIARVGPIVFVKVTMINLVHILISRVSIPMRSFITYYHISGYWQSWLPSLLLILTPGILRPTYLRILQYLDKTEYSRSFSGGGFKNLTGYTTIYYHDQLACWIYYEIDPANSDDWIKASVMFFLLPLIEIGWLQRRRLGSLINSIQ